ncbi:recombinase family protein [Sphingomonas sp. 2R-10]|uniref:recombinase family protein n=1 Tax=Sphingomonas sp. 2R-10 TaxID=3045148 RepID=UPI001F49E8D9
MLVVWKLDRLGRSLPHLLSIITDFRTRDIAFRSLTEAMDTTTPHGELLFSMFGALAQYERALTRERVMAGLAAAKRRGRQGGRPPMIDAEKIEAITAALDGGASKAAVYRNFGVARSTLIDTLARIGWTAPARSRSRVPRSSVLTEAQRADLLALPENEATRCVRGIRIHGIRQGDLPWVISAVFRCQVRATSR